LDGGAESDCDGAGSLFVTNACAYELGMFGINMIDETTTMIMIANNLFLLLDLVI
jgi:hypothetical protein